MTDRPHDAFDAQDPHDADPGRDTDAARDADASRDDAAPADEPRGTSDHLGRPAADDAGALGREAGAFGQDADAEVESESETGHPNDRRESLDPAARRAWLRERFGAAADFFDGAEGDDDDADADEAFDALAFSGADDLDFEPGDGPATAPTDPLELPVDVLRTHEGLVMIFDLPGVGPGDVQLAARPGVLRIRARRRLPVPDGVEAIHRERAVGSVERHVPLPADVVPNRMEARLEHGVLLVRLPSDDTANEDDVAPDDPAAAYPGEDGSDWA